MNTADLQKIADYFADAKLHDFEATVQAAIHEIKSLEENRDWYRERVVWGFYEDSIPHYIQGSEGEHEINEPVTAVQVRSVYKALDIYERERARYRHSKPEITGEYFLAGGYGERDKNMLPEYVEIVAAYGCGWSQVYKKTDRTISYEGS
jgi:hypothetical protein